MKDGQKLVDMLEIEEGQSQMHCCTIDKNGSLSSIVRRWRVKELLYSG